MYAYIRLQNVSRLVEFVALLKVCTKKPLLCFSTFALIKVTNSLLKIVEFIQAGTSWKKIFLFLKNQIWRRIAEWNRFMFHLGFQITRWKTRSWWSPSCHSFSSFLPTDQFRIWKQNLCATRQHIPTSRRSVPTLRECLDLRHVSKLPHNVRDSWSFLCLYCSTGGFGEEQEVAKQKLILGKEILFRKFWNS